MSGWTATHDRNADLIRWLHLAALWHATAVTLTISKHPADWLPGVSTHSMYRSITYALGMTIELLTKALIVQKHGAWSPPKPGKGHGTADLFKVAGVQLDVRLKEVARELEQSVRWMSRYPDSLKPETRNMARRDSILSDYNLIVTTIVGGLSADNESLYKNILLDEYRAEFIVPTLGA
jgi:hypothetical protein